MKVFFSIFLFLLAFSLSAQTDKDSALLISNADLAVDSLAFEEDTTVNLDVIFAEQLIIPSYEDLLEVYYNAVVKVDERLNFNVFRYRPDDKVVVNAYIFDEVIYEESQFDITSTDTAQEHQSRNAKVIFSNVKSDLTLRNPDVFTATWDMIPDPPKAERQSVRRSVTVDLSRIDTASQRRIRTPKKIKKVEQLYVPWHYQIMTMANASQTAFSYWAKGGDNSFAVSGRLVADATYASYDEKTKWDNDLEFRLGYVQQQDRPFVKNLDYFRLNSRFARNAINRWFYAANAELTTQFFEGYNLKKGNYTDPISNFFTPAYLKLAIGLNYKYGTRKQKKLFSMQASPLSGKFTFVRDTNIVKPQKYGVEEGQRYRAEMGGSLELGSKYTIKDKFDGNTRLLLFSNYLEKPQNIDINWNTRLTYHISRIISVNFTLDMMYDDDVDILIRETEDGEKIYGQRLQIKEYLGFGLTYRLM